MHISNPGIWTCVGVLGCANHGASVAMQHYAVKTLENIYTKENLWPETLAHPSAAGRQLCIAMTSIASLTLRQDIVFAFPVLSLQGWLDPHESFAQIAQEYHKRSLLPYLPVGADVHDHGINGST